MAQIDKMAIMGVITWFCMSNKMAYIGDYSYLNNTQKWTHEGHLYAREFYYIQYSEFHMISFQLFFF